MRNGSGVLCAVLLGLLAACGGGGGGGGSGGGSSSQGPVTYSGSTSAASLSNTNSSAIASDVVGSGTATGVFASVESTSPSGAAGAGVSLAMRSLQKGLRSAPPFRNGGRGAPIPAGVPVNQTTPCDSGSVTTTGDLNSNGTGTLSMTFSACRSGDVTVAGSASLRIDSYSQSFGTPLDFTFTFSRLTVQGASLNVALGGSARSVLSVPANTEVVTLNAAMVDLATGRMTKTENLVTTVMAGNILNPTTFTQVIAGRIYDGLHGYVDVATFAPFFFSSSTQEFPESGQMVMTGSSGRHVRLTALGAQAAKLELDFDGDNVYERSAVLRWSELSGPGGADLADADGDGMHNSWETAHGLNPNDPSDANTDRDGDGVSNKAEYLSGTDPNSAASAPQPAGLSLASATDTPDPVAAGSALVYTIGVANTGPAAAANVVLTETLPASVTFVSASTTGGSCSGSGPVVCDLGLLSPGVTLSISIVVTTTTPGVISSTATVTSSTFDSDLTNNSRTITTTVGTPVTGLQAGIDAAAPGATLLAGPGIYVGALNFNGKDITLQSSAGPATTVLTGAPGDVIQIGPGGALKGFNITGLGVQTSGAGSLISGNIFEGNGGPFGLAVSGNTSSPVIERNIFRNSLSCLPPTVVSGVVVFVNMSSPQIVNNLFVNNPCVAINLTLPQGTAPQVINNTFVGNAFAIRVDRRVPQGSQVFRNNLIAQNGTGLFIEFGSDADNPVWQNNLMFGNTTDYSGTAILTGTNGNISGDPRFVNASGADYHLGAGSAAIDTGSGTNAPTVDFDGNPRPRDGDTNGSNLWDIGAFEKQ